MAYGSLFSPGVLPRLAFAPGWALVDAQGERVASESYRGAVALYTFTYAHNRDARRQVGRVMRAVQDRLDGEEVAVPVRPVSTPVDGARDTPDVLRRHAAAVGADPERWTLATADPAALCGRCRRASLVRAAARRGRPV